MQENRLPPSPTETLAEIRRLKANLGALIFFGGVILLGILGAVIGWACFPAPNTPTFGAVVGVFAGLLPLLMFMSVIDQVLNWMYHMLAIQNKLLETALQREATQCPQKPLSPATPYERK